MTEEEYIIWHIEQDSKLREAINSSYINAEMENIKLMRNLVIQFITISAAIIGFTIPVLGRAELVKITVLLVGGLAELLVVIIYGLWYLTSILQKENKNLTKQHNNFNSYLDRPKEARNKFLTDMTEDNRREWQDRQQEVLDEIRGSSQDQQKPDYALDIIFGAFFVALLLVVLSLVDFSKYALLF